MWQRHRNSGTLISTTTRNIFLMSNESLISIHSSALTENNVDNRGRHEKCWNK